MKKLNNQQDELLERMFAGEVTPDDESQLLRHYADPDFKDELRFQLNLRKALQMEHAQSPLRKELEGIGQRLAMRQRIRSGILATLGIVLVGLLFLPPVREKVQGLLFSKNPKSDEIGAFIILPIDPRQAGDQIQIDEANYQKGRTSFFVDKKYEEAIGYLEKVSSSSPYYDPSRILIAHAWLKTQKNLSAAISIFDTYIQQNEKLQQLKSEVLCDVNLLKWNRMLAYQLNGESEKYCAELASFLNLPDGDFYKNKAKGLSQKVKCQ